MDMPQASHLYIAIDRYSSSVETAVYQHPLVNTARY
jgi:hypothetical protein